MADIENSAAPVDQVNVDDQLDEQFVEISPQKEQYLDPEGGYANPEVGRQAELTAMTKQAPVSVNNLPTKAYLEETITPTVLRALSEVCKARPDNPLEFVAYYMLKHNPNRELKSEGAPTGYRHPEDKSGEEDGEGRPASGV